MDSVLIEKAVLIMSTTANSPVDVNAIEVESVHPSTTSPVRGQVVHHRVPSSRSSYSQDSAETSSIEIEYATLPLPPLFNSKRGEFLLMSALGFMLIFATRITPLPSLIILNPNGESKTGHETEIQSWAALAETSLGNPKPLDLGIIGAFFIGYLFLQIPGGYFAGRGRGHTVFLLSLLGVGLCHLCSPFAATLGRHPLWIIRFIKGLFEGLSVPAMHSLIARWAPKHERSRMGGFIYGSSLIGTILANLSATYLTRALGWQSNFYVFGGLTILLSIKWWFSAFDSPRTHTRISVSERLAIWRDTNPPRIETLFQIPWQSILRCISFRRVLICHIVYSFGLFIICNELPKYLQDIHHNQILQSPNWALIPLGVNFVSVVFAGHLADFLQIQNWLSVWNVRKIFFGIGSFGTCIFLLAFILLSGIPGWVLPLFCLILFTNGFAMLGFFITHIDLSTKYAGPLMGISNLLATLMGFVAPICVSTFMDGFIGDESKWNGILYFLMSIYALTGIYFIYGLQNEPMKIGEQNNSPDPATAPSEQEPLISHN
ncbi:sialin-like [Tigriopus californicus]|uniref:sialin-like n=1 Tax=Tigriopus californicus TaxID=6832 RepID=UPI0027D9F124|nr:sialin-like [Tigriopus californicus]